MLSIKVLGPGCANCKRLEQMVRKTVEILAVEAEMVKVSDYGEMAELGVLATPGLIINDQVVVKGRLPTHDEVTTWITEAL